MGEVLEWDQTLRWLSGTRTVPHLVGTQEPLHPLTPFRREKEPSEQFL